MTEYFYQNYNIITVIEYLKNIQFYNCFGIIQVEDKKYLEAISKDFKKDIYCNLIDRGIDPKTYGTDISKLSLSNYNFVYLIIDAENIESFIKNKDVYHWFIIDIVEILDIPEVNKFELVVDIIRRVDIDIIIKLERAKRKEFYPIPFDNASEDFMYIEEYMYDGLDI